MSAVVLYHAGLPFLPGGYVGVDVFFVISGFLITSHLLSALERDGRVRFASFYAKRARRILPASFLVLALTVLAAVVWFPPLLMEQVWQGAVATALYVPNILFAIQGTDYLAETTPSLFQHYWSLGIEEQFYLVWPAVLALGWAFVKSRGALLWLLVALVGISFALCVVLTFRDQPWAFFSLPTRAWELGVGGIVAYACARWSRPLAPRVAVAAGWIGVAGVLAAVLLFDSGMAFPGYAALVPVAGTALIILGGATPTSAGPGRTLSVRPAVFIGTISYSLYLVHWPALIIPQGAVGFENPLPLPLTLAIAVACVAVAWLLYRFVEDPARNARWWAAARPRRTLTFSLAGSVAAVLVATLAYVGVAATPLSSTLTAPPAAASEFPEGTGFVPSNMNPDLESVSEDQPELYADGCHRGFEATAGDGCTFGPDGAPRIALFGDSHAAQWFPALIRYAEEQNFAVTTYTKSACPSVDVEVVRSGVEYVECSEWRENVVDELNADPPALVLISNYGSTTVETDAGATHADAWALGLARTIDGLEMPAAVLSDTPDLSITPSVCLSANLDSALDCAAPRSEAVDSTTRDAEERVAAESGTPMIDLTDAMCNPDMCPAIIGSTLVYRDAHHITATFSETLAEPLGTQIDPLLPEPAGASGAE